MVVRRLTKSDEAGWRARWQGDLEFYKASLHEATTAATVQQPINDGRFFSFIAERRGRL